MKVSTKLYLGFSVPILMMIVLIVVGLMNMAAIKGNMERIITVNNVRANLAHDVAANVRDIEIGISMLIINKTDEERQIEKKKIDEERGRYLADLKKIVETTAKDDGKGQQIIARVMSNQEAARDANVKLVELISANKDAEATETMTGGEAMIERSRTPVSASCRVRGIGVALSVSTWTSARSAFKRSLWETPKCCSSSTTTRPRSLN